MISITTTHQPATDLGYLLHKNPFRAHPIDLTFGRAVVAFPEATTERCTATLLLEIDPVGLVRSPGGSLSQYVNDRPYVASSFLSSALTRAFGTAAAGRCKDRPELVDVEIPFEVTLPVIGSKSGESGIRALFEPLGYTVTVQHLELDNQFPEWGESDYFALTLSAKITMQNLLQQLYVLLPVLDAKKHYYSDFQEVDKLVRKGGGWLANHPQKDWIVRSFLSRKPSLIREALEQLSNAEPELEMESELVDVEVPEVKQRTLHEQRHDRVVEVIRDLKPKSVADLGCGDGKLIRQLIPIKGLERILGMDVSYYELEKAARRFRLEDAGPKMRERLTFLHGSLMYRDQRLEGFDVATAVEVIEHLDSSRLQAFERVVFECAKPCTVIVTTPNSEFNVLYERLDGFRHTDHRFEWSRAEFEAWGQRVAATFGYSVRFEGLGEAHDVFGSPSQMAVFSQ